MMWRLKMKKQTFQRYFCSCLVSLLLLSSLFFGILGRATNDDVGNLETSSFTITHLSTNKASVGETVSVYGSGFGLSQGYIVVSGLVVEPVSWSDTEVVFIVPEHAASGFLYVCNALLIKSNILDLTIDRNLLQHQLEPYGFTLEETGLLGSALLVETDGEYLYGITGFETLCTYKINEDSPFELCSIISLPQRVGDLRIHNGYLFVSGDHGLYVFQNTDLQQGKTTPVAALAGASYLTMDAKEKTGQPIEGTLLALCEYVPTVHTQVLRVPLFQFQDEELLLLGTFSRTVLTTERQHALAIDPLNPKVYVSGYQTLLGEDKYLLEIDISDPSSPSLNHRLETGKLLGFDMDTKNDILWLGILSTGTEFFRTYRLKAGTDHLVLDDTVHGAHGLGRTTRVRLIDDFATVGSAWAGARPDVFLLDTFDSDSTPLASADSLDWAFDVTGYAINEQSGKIIVADEWGGFLTYEYELSPVPSITHQKDYRWTPASAMTENLYLTDERIYAANRGAGIWSADKLDVSDNSNWRHSDWDWELDDPQPHPISALSVREDPTYGTLIAARGNNKAMAWGSTHYGILYRETSTSIEQLAISDEITPPFSLFSGSPGFSVEWPEPDLVYMATGTDGFRAFVVNPEEPSITIHNNCRDEGFGRSHFGTNRTVSDMYYYHSGHEQKMVIASTLSSFVNEPTITVLDVSYPEGIPDRHNPERAIHVSFNSSLNCLTGKSITYFDMSPSGMIAAATSQGIAVFHLSWIPALNEMSNTQAWNRIKIPEDSYIPYWDATFSSSFKDVSFGDEHMLYAVKNPQGKNIGGLWAIDVQVDWEQYTHNCLVMGYYPGVQCGIDYNNLLQGWGNPDIVTLHHPYVLESEGNTVFVTGWSGKIDRLTFNTDNRPPAPPSIHGPSNGKVGTTYSYMVSSTDPDGDDLFYSIEWGDGQVKDWFGPYQSGNEVTVEHTWSRQGSFILRAKTRDIHGGVSDWGSLEVSMPKERISEHPFIQFLQELLELVIHFIRPSN
jgi:hypothetical protein